MKYIHIFIDFFANGKSDMKIYLFLAFFIGVLLIKKLSKENREHRTKLKKTLLVFVFLLYALNIGSFAYFFTSNNIPYLSNVYVFNNHEISSTNILHNHTMKAPIGFLLEQAGVNPVQEYVDTGYAFTTFFSNTFSIIVLILIFVLILTLMLYIRGQKNSVGQIFIFSIISFSVLKNIFDGGFFHIETVLALSAFLILLTDRTTFVSKHQKGNLLFFATHLFVTTVLAWITSQYLPLHGMAFMKEFLVKLGFFFALLVLYYRKQVPRFFVALSTLPVLIVFYTFALHIFITDYEYKQTIVNPSQDILGYITRPLSPIFVAESSVDFTNTSWVRGHAARPVSKSELIKNMGRADSFSNLKIKDADCDISVKYIRSFDTRKNQSEMEEGNDVFVVKKIGSTVQILDNGCSYINQSMLAEIFAKHGIYQIILIQNDPVAF